MTERSDLERIIDCIWALEEHLKVKTEVRHLTRRRRRERWKNPKIFIKASKYRNYHITQCAMRHKDKVFDVRVISNDGRF